MQNQIKRTLSSITEIIHDILAHLVPYPFYYTEIMRGAKYSYLVHRHGNRVEKVINWCHSARAWGADEWLTGEFSTERFLNPPKVKPPQFNNRSVLIKY